MMQLSEIQTGSLITDHSPQQWCGGSMRVRMQWHSKSVMPSDPRSVLARCGLSIRTGSVSGSGSPPAMEDSVHSSPFMTRSTTHKVRAC